MAADLSQRKFLLIVHFEKNPKRSICCNNLDRNKEIQSLLDSMILDHQVRFGVKGASHFDYL